MYMYRARTSARLQSGLGKCGHQIGAWQHVKTAALIAVVILVVEARAWAQTPWAQGDLVVESSLA